MSVHLGVIDIRYTKVYLMQVSKWGNSLAIRLPATIVEALELKEGDEIEVTIMGQRDVGVARDRRKDKAIERLRQLAKPLPPGWKFDREEANER
jgi:antitoxin MazE